MTEKATHLKIVKGITQAGLCPICSRPALAPHTPFCSRRCAQLDLGKWLTGEYAIPAYEEMDDSDIDMFLAAHEASSGDQSDEDR